MQFLATLTRAAPQIQCASSQHRSDIALACMNLSDNQFEHVIASLVPMAQDLPIMQSQQYQTNTASEQNGNLVADGLAGGFEVMN